MRKHTLIKRSLAVGLIAGSVAFPAGADAMFLQGTGGIRSAPRVPVAASQSPQVAGTAPVQSGSSSFRWGDAGVGAAAATLLLGSGALGTAVTRRRRVQRPVSG